MANLTRTVAASGADHTTIAAAFSHMVANFTYSGNDIATIQLDASEEYNESNLTIGGIPGTESITSYLVIEATPAHRHDGTYNTSKARIRGNTNGEHVFILADGFVHLRYLAIKQDSAGASDEGIRITSGALQNQLIEKCVIETANVNQQDGIHAPQIDITSITVFDTVIKMGGSSARAGINAQMFELSGTFTQTWHIEHCTIDANGAGEAGGSGISAEANDTGYTVNMNVNNCAVFDSTGDDYDEQANNGTITWVGQGNIGSDTSCTAKLGATNNLNSQTLSVTDEAATEFLVASLTSGSENYQLIDGASSTDNAIGAAIDGSTRDSRIDLTVDIAGNARPATYTERDIGAFEVVAAGGVVITDVNTTETWDDGDAGLVITGTGFV